MSNFTCTTNPQHIEVVEFVVDNIMVQLSVVSVPPVILRLISSWSTNSKMCGAFMSIEAVPVMVTARKMHSCSLSITIAIYLQSSRIYSHQTHAHIRVASWCSG